MENFTTPKMSTNKLPKPAPKRLMEQYHPQQVAEEAAPPWESLPGYERRDYEATKPANIDCPIESINRKINEAAEFERCMIEEIEETVQGAGIRLNLTNFHIMHVNYFCFVMGEQRYYPAEIAVVRFNLQNGVTCRDVFHSMWNPGPIPLGYAFTAEQNAKATHRITGPKDTYPNTATIFKRLDAFLSADMDVPGNLPPLYVLQDNFEKACTVMKTLCVDHKRDKNYYRVYALEQLFYRLRNHICLLKDKPMVDLLVNSPIRILDKDPYAYEKSIGCQEHKDLNVTTYCSKSIAMRLAFGICEHCCPLYNISLIPGQHVPGRAEIPALPVAHNSNCTAPKKNCRTMTNPRPTIGDELPDRFYRAPGTTTNWRPLPRPRCSSLPAALSDSTSTETAVESDTSSTSNSPEWYRTQMVERPSPGSAKFCQAMLGIADIKRLSQQRPRGRGSALKQTT